MYYRIDWDAIHRLPLDQQMHTLSRIGEDVRSITSAARTRLAVHTHTRLDTGHGSVNATAHTLGVPAQLITTLRKRNEENPMTVTTTPVAPAELYHRYPNQNQPQDTYIEIDLEARTVRADYNGAYGGGITSAVLNGFERRYPIPALTSTAANNLLEQVRPLAERMVADWTEEWDGNNMVAVLGDDAQAAEVEIQDLIGRPRDWEASQMVTVRDIDGAVNGDEAEEWGITAQTTDERLEEIEEQIRQNLADISESDEVVLEGVGEYLKQVRDEATERE